MKRYCPNCQTLFDNSDYCSLCGSKIKTCIFHKWEYTSEFMRVCKKCGQTQTKGLTYGWSNHEH